VNRLHVDRGIRRVGVVIPVCNEELLLRRSLVALERSLLDVTNHGFRARVVVVLDSCRDASADIAREWKERAHRSSAFDVTLIDFEGENVGRARALGCDVFLDDVTAEDLAEIWIATTDADSRVPAHWLRTQLREHNLGADAWAGRVAVTDWPRHRLAGAAAWQRAYDAEARPIHGASLGVVAAKYVEVGGFPSLRTGEDRALCAALIAHGAHVHYDSSAPVVTSARRHARAPEGFASALTRFDVSALKRSHDELDLRST
jgi:cellulose synthase/poly-beta-1,6-N-acetylglucosamine synthase-like glycosyltransferase